MILPTLTQLYYFILVIISGVFTGVMFDIYRICRGLDSPKRVLTAVSDTLFWILAGLIIFLFFLYTNHANFGYYTFVGLFIGLYLYLKYLSRPFTKMLNIIIYYSGKILRVMIVILIYPFKLFYYRVKHLSRLLKKSKKKNHKLEGKIDTLKNNIL